MNNIRRQQSKKRKTIKILITIVITLIVISALYLTFVFSNIPFIRYWRGIWIETAMTTGDHQWLATYFIPQNIIDDVMSTGSKNDDIIGGKDFLETKDEATAESNDTETKPNTTEANSDISETPDEGPDILNQKEIVVGEPDYAGYTVLINDIDEGLVVSEIAGEGYKGRVMLIDDPSRVSLVSTISPSGAGMRILSVLEQFGAVAGINASGFYDPGGEGDGSIVIGRSYDGINYSGSYSYSEPSILLTEADKLVTGYIFDWEQYDIRAGMQFGPVLIADGEVLAEGSYGYGIHPRTAIGQREDGVIVFLIVDGRDISYSIGCTVGDLAKILQKYEVVNAACCDGGSSSVLAYKGEVLNRNSSLNPAYGRMLPNAFIVKSKNAENNNKTEES